jgi:hypothetical protein
LISVRVEQADERAGKRNKAAKARNFRPNPNQRGGSGFVLYLGTWHSDQKAQGMN